MRAREGDKFVTVFGCIRGNRLCHDGREDELSGNRWGDLPWGYVQLLEREGKLYVMDYLAACST